LGVGASVWGPDFTFSPGEGGTVLGGGHEGWVCKPESVPGGGWGAGSASPAGGARGGGGARPPGGTSLPGPYGGSKFLGIFT